MKGGTRDEARTEVVGFFVNPPHASGVGFCTGSLIAPNVVLTARHCVSDMTGSGIICADETVNGTPYTATRALSPAPPSRFEVTQVTDVTVPGPLNPSTVKEVRVPIDAGTPVCGNDLALLVLSAPIATPRLVPVRATPVVVGETLTAVGYGYDGAIQNSDGVRRSRGGLGVLFLGPLRGTSGRIAVTENDYVMPGPCGGDSGGPALDDAGFSVGVMSRGNATVCEQMIYTQAAPHHAWLAAEVRAATLDAGVETPAWARATAVDAGTPDGGSDDAGFDAGIDAGTPDGGSDDAGFDAGIDAGLPPPDAGVEPMPNITVPAVPESPLPAAPIGCAATPAPALLFGALALLRRRHVSAGR